MANNVVSLPDQGRRPAAATSIVAKFTAADVEAACPERLFDLGKQFKSHMDEGLKSEAAAEQHYLAAQQVLAEVEKICDEGGLFAFKDMFCPHVGHSCAYELRAILTGKKSPEEIKAASRQRQARSRARRRGVSVTVTENSAASHIGKCTGTGEVFHLRDWKTGREYVEPDQGDDGADGNTVSDFAAPIPPITTTKKPSLPEVWDGAPPKEQQLIRDLFLTDYFAHANGADVLDHIPADRCADVVRGFLDQPGVDAIQWRYRTNFGAKLHDPGTSAFKPHEREQTDRIRSCQNTPTSRIWSVCSKRVLIAAIPHSKCVRCTKRS